MGSQIKADPDPAVKKKSPEAESEAGTGIGKSSRESLRCVDGLGIVCLVDQLPGKRPPNSGTTIV